MELQHLRVFYEVAKRGSVSAAANALRVTQPAVSRSVQNLEGDLQKKLFSRHPRGVTLTADGERVFERCHKIFQECAAIAGTEVEEPAIRIAASENLCIHVFPKIFAKKKASQLELFSGTAEEIIQSVMAGNANAGYCYHPSKAPGLSSMAITSVEFWLIASPELFDGNPATKDLRKFPFIGSFSKHYRGPYAAKSLLADAGLAIDGAHQCNSQETQVAMVECGLGYSLVPWFMVKDRINGGSLIRVPLKKTLKTPLYRISRLADQQELHNRIDSALKAAIER